MELGALIFLGLLVGLAFMLHIFKLGLKRIAGYDIQLDLFLSFMLMFLFHGSQGGMAVAIIGGLVISVTLRMLRWTIGYQKMGLYKKPYQYLPFLKPIEIPQMVWYDYPSVFRTPKGMTQKEARIPIL
jgi:hypothetical protein